MSPLGPRIKHKLDWLFRRYIRREVVTVGVERWYRLSPTQGLLFDHHLPANPVIFDVGGFTGEWAAPMHARYGGTLHVFEPLPAYVTVLKKRFAKKRGVLVHPFGLAAADGSAEIALLGQGSTAYSASADAPRQTIRLRGVKKVVDDLAPGGIDLLAINAEGAEYELLETLVNSKQINKINTLLVQFHPLVKDYRRRYRQLADKLARTHRLVFRVPFVWEKWVRKS